MFVSCKKESSLVSVSFDIDGFESVHNQGSFDLESAPKGGVSDYCSMISCAIFLDGKKVKTITQEVTDDNFGRLDFRLPAGKYQLVVIAHNGQQHCTISSLEKVTFNGKCSDTFYRIDTLDCVSDTVCPLVLRRAVAKIRLVTTDPVPSGVKTMRFYYYGGSSTFNPTTGYGSVNSRQTEYREVSSTMVGHAASFEVYSFPHQEEDTIRLNVKALNSNEETLFEDTFIDLVIRRNWITQHTTAFFTAENHDHAMNISLEDDGEWSGIINSK